MAKGIGLIGNFRGKVGNMVGYNLKDSNNKQTQGVRVYQPIVKNPKTYAQAEQRAKLAPINATYRALKMIIDRGQEGKAYGNKSRLAWLSEAMKAFAGGWFKKGAAITAPALVPLTKGSLGSISADAANAQQFIVLCSDITESTITTIGQATPLILAANSQMREGDQITCVGVQHTSDGIQVKVNSIVLDASSTELLPYPPKQGDGEIRLMEDLDGFDAKAIILSREGDNGAHLRSNASLVATNKYDADLLADAAKEAAIKSYMTGGSNTDWAEESLRD